FVGLGLGCSREVEPLEPARFLAERIQRGELRVDESGPILTTVDPETLIVAARDDNALGEGLTELGGKGEAVLVIDGVLVRAEEHLRPVSFYHYAPLCPTITHLPTLAQRRRAAR